MRMEPEQIEFVASQIGYIDSGERNMFLETVNTDGQIDVRLYEGQPGVCYCCFGDDNYRIHVSFIEDTEYFNKEIANFIRTALAKTKAASCLLWVLNKNRKIIEFLKDEFQISPNGKHYYASIEFIMRRENFKKPYIHNALEIRPYEESHLDSYLRLLDGAMTFVDPPPAFGANNAYFSKEFAELAHRNSFEAFWKDSEIIGLYWRKHAEIDIMAVAEEHQRNGYGAMILSRAISMVFENTAADYAYLYAVDWNEKGQSFYKKYGMEQNGHSCLLNLNIHLKGGDNA